VLTSIPHIGVVRAFNYGGAVGDIGRFTGPDQVYKLSGLVPKLYESAGKRRGGAAISRAGKVELREAILELGKGLRQGHPDFGDYARRMKQRGKPGGVILCALGHRANRLAFAMIGTRSASTQQGGRREKRTEPSCPTEVDHHRSEPPADLIVSLANRFGEHPG
jgi:transposase